MEQIAPFLCINFLVLTVENFPYYEKRKILDWKFFKIGLKRKKINNENKFNLLILILPIFLSV